MATDKRTNMAPAPKPPEHKRVKDFVCAGCNAPVSSRKSVWVEAKLNRYCLACAVRCDHCHQYVLKVDLLAVDGQMLCPACCGTCTSCGKTRAVGSLRKCGGRLLCPEHLTTCRYCAQEVPVDDLINGLCPGCRAHCMVCEDVGIRASMTWGALDGCEDGGYVCSKHKVTVCVGCGSAHVDVDLPIVDHPNKERGKVPMCPDCAPKCFICGKHKAKHFLVYRNCGIHGMKYVCPHHKVIKADVVSPPQSKEVSNA